jgi:hypothetical protein
VKLIDRLTGTRQDEARYSLADWLADSSPLNQYSFNGVAYTPQYTYQPGGKIEPSSNDFRGHSDDYRTNAVIFSCMAFRASSPRRASSSGRSATAAPATLFGNATSGSSRRRGRTAPRATS